MYHVSYDTVPADEAIDLIETLPKGSLYKATLGPALAWTDEQHRHADLLDAIHELTWAMAIDKEKVPEPPLVARPADVARRAAVMSDARRARRILESNQWEEV